MPFFSNPLPIINCPAPENCTTSISVLPILGVPLLVKTKPLLEFIFPSSTKTKEPPVNSLPSSSGTARSSLYGDVFEPNSLII